MWLRVEQTLLSIVYTFTYFRHQIMIDMYSDVKVFVWMYMNIRDKSRRECAFCDDICIHGVGILGRLL